MAAGLLRFYGRKHSTVLSPKRPLRPISREICRSGHILCACASRTKNDVVSVGTGVVQSARVQGLCHQGAASVLSARYQEAVEVPRWSFASSLEMLGAVVAP